MLGGFLERFGSLERMGKLPLEKNTLRGQEKHVTCSGVILLTSVCEQFEQWWFPFWQPLGVPEPEKCDLSRAANHVEFTLPPKQGQLAPQNRQL